MGKPLSERLAVSSVESNGGHTAAIFRMRAEALSGKGPYSCPHGDSGLEPRSSG